MKRRVSERKRIVKWVVAALCAACFGIFSGLYLYPELHTRRPAYEAGVAAMEQGAYLEAVRQFEICGEAYRDAASLTEECLQKQQDSDIDSLETELDPDGSGQEDDAVLEEIRTFVSAYAYSALSEEEQDQIRTGIRTGMIRFLSEGQTDAVKEIIRILTDAYGEESLWKAERTYAEAELAEEDADCMRCLKETEALQEAGMPDADMYVEMMRKRCLEAADTLAGTYKEDTEDSKKAAEALRMYGVVSDALPEAETSRKSFCKYVKKQADQALEDESFELAKDLYEVLADVSWKGAGEALQKTWYQMGDALYEAEDYLGAVRAWYMAADYQDADEKSKEAKYLYCQQTSEAPDEMTIRYLGELEEASYPGIGQLAEEIHRWHAKVTLEQVNEDSTQAFMIYAELHGGDPEEETALEFVVEGTAEEHYVYETEERYQDGDTASMIVDSQSMFGEIDLSAYRVEVYDEQGNLIGTSGEDETER